MSTLSIKVDVDTFEGARAGVPRLLDMFADLGVHASFFFSYGPDNAGKAIWNIFRQRGFLRKMVRTRALRMYGLRTALSGTLLRARVVSQELDGLIREVQQQGHEVGMHGWDHRLWQDRLPDLSTARVAEEIERAMEAQRTILGESPRAFAAPGWMANDMSMLALAERGLLYSSSTRFGEPFYPVVEGQRLRLLEIPSTTWCPEECMVVNATMNPFPTDISAEEEVVYPAHAEVEGGLFLEGFRGWLGSLLEQGARVIRLEDRALSLRDNEGASLPHRPLTRGRIPGRPMEVSTGYPELCPG